MDAPSIGGLSATWIHEGVVRNKGMNICQVECALGSERSALEDFEPLVTRENVRATPVAASCERG